MSAAARGLRGFQCEICKTWGDHYPRDCPRRGEVGRPKGVSEMPAGGALAALMVQGNFLTPRELTSVVLRRKDVPAALRCFACGVLPMDVVWTRCCDVVACAACLSPPSCAWRCPKCGTEEVDVFHVVTALRAVTNKWALAAMRSCDPYCVSSDDDCEQPSHPPPHPVVLPPPQPPQFTAYPFVQPPCFGAQANVPLPLPPLPLLPPPLPPAARGQQNIAEQPAAIEPRQDAGRASHRRRGRKSTKRPPPA